jgi:o-succinylbenzoate synthase
MSIWNINDKLVAEVERYDLKFKFLAKTSRDELKTKETFFIKIWRRDQSNFKAIGECSPLWGLSIDPKQDYFELLKMIALDINNYKRWLRDRLIEYPSIRCGIEMALLNLQQGKLNRYFDNEVAKGNRKILINGLIWMGSFDEMRARVDEKLKAGFDTIKIKIGGIHFSEELALLKYIRNHDIGKSVTLRLDANGAFSTEEAKSKLEQLSKFNIHSIEQPIKQGQWKAMSELAKSSPIPIGLDEELIGIEGREKKAKLLDILQPHYLIIKPSLVGGFESAAEWIELAEKRNIGWWITSALESNIGLNAIKQFTGNYMNQEPQGLGTGELFENNLSCA